MRAPRVQLDLTSRGRQLARAAAFTALSFCVAVAGAAQPSDWTNTGLAASQVRNLAPDPSDSSTFYAAALEGGVYKTVDRAESWLEARNGLPAATIIEVLVDPVDTDTLYAVSYSSSGGLFKSVDGGASWSALGRGPVVSMVIDPQTPSILYVGSTSGVTKSLDQGATFQPAGGGLPRTTIYDLAIDPDEPTTVYAALGREGVFKTVDGGSGWEAINEGIANQNGAYYVFVDPAEPQVLYARTGRGLARSPDGGLSWLTAVDVPPVESLAVDPSDERVLYALGRGGQIYRSLDRGFEWEALGDGAPRLPDRPRESFWSFAPLESGGFLVGATCGAFRTDPQGADWRYKSRGLLSGRATTLASDPERPGIVYASSLRCGRFKSSNAGRSWKRLPDADGTQVSSLAIDPTRPRTVYAGTNRGLYRSENGGNRWVRLPTESSGVFVSSTASEVAASAERIYAAFSRFLFASQDRGDEWTLVSRRDKWFSIREILIDPDDSATVYVGTGARGVLRSRDGGVTWKRRSRGLPRQRKAPVGIAALAADPSDPLVFYVGPTREGVFKTTDGARSWVRSWDGPAGVSATALVVDPQRPSIVFAGTSDGAVYRSEDAGSSWNVVGSPDVLGYVEDLALSAGRLLAAGPSGVFALEVD